MMFTSATTIDRLLQIRPGAVEFIESLDIGFWKRLELSVEDFCRERKLDAANLLKTVSGLPVPSKESDWYNEPLHRLLDYLTAEHRHFQGTDLPEISHLLDLHNIPVYPDGYVLRRIFQSYKSFEEKFLSHMREEEEHVFPHILRLEASIRNASLHPQLHRVSVKVFAVMQSHPAEEDLKRSVADISEKVRHHRLQEPTASVTGTIHRKLEELEDRLAAHAALEVEILFPRAVEIEKRVMERELGIQREILPYTAPI